MKIRIRTLVIAFLLAGAAGGAFVYAGIYNIAATEQHTAPVYWLLEYAMHRSVKNFSDEVQPPPLADEGRVRNGFRIYREKCLQCHGAPGIAPHDLAYGLTPAPASLAATAREWEPSEIYWVIRYGIKMSGMPGWEYRLSDREIWDVVAFVRRLHAFSPRGYAEWGAYLPQTMILETRFCTQRGEIRLYDFFAMDEGAIENARYDHVRIVDGM